MEDLQLEDMLESYPSQMTQNFQQLLSAKEEFRELASDQGERLPPGRGNYFKHQKFTHRFMRAYDNILILSETGTGKSCEVLGFTEYTRTELEKAKIDPLTADEKASHYKRVIVLVKGKAQKNEFKNQLTCKCSDGRYETNIVKKAQSESVQKQNVTLGLKKAGYEIVTYQTFASTIKNKFPEESDDEELSKTFSDTIFWIDEAHNLIAGPSTTRTFKRKDDTYNTIWRLLHVVKRSKIIISTATPMINDQNDLKSVINLILPMDKNMPVDYDYRNAPDRDIEAFFGGDYNVRNLSREKANNKFRGQLSMEDDLGSMEIDELEPFFRGRVGFIRSAETLLNVQEEGKVQTGIFEHDGVQYKSQIKVYAKLMSEFQTQCYERSTNVDSTDDIYISQRQASNFVFPDGNWGTGGQSPDNFDLMVGAKRKGFSRYIINTGNTFKPTAEFFEKMGSGLSPEKRLEKIRKYSVKYATAIEEIIKSPGNCFVYNEYVDGSGAIAFAACLEVMGFERFDESQSVFTSTSSNKIKDFCSAGNSEPEKGRKIRKNFSPMSSGGAPKFALLTGKAIDAKIQTMLEAMNSYENRHGDLIKVFISSRIGKEGINVSNIVQIHLIGPEWNQSAIYQALSRGIRATSHYDLIAEEKERLKKKGIDPDKAKINVSIFKHAAIPTRNGGSCIDLQMYRMAELKDRQIRRIMRMLQQCAIGCQIHYNRNVLDTDEDFSPKCNYEKCRYPCYDPEPSTIDYSTYDVLYSDEIVNGIADKIIKIYSFYNSLSLQQILDLLESETRQKYVILALQKIIKNKTAITNKFGYKTYLREDKGIFYLDLSYPGLFPPSQDMSYYTKDLICVQQKSLEDISNQLKFHSNQQLIDQIINSDEDDDDENFLDDFNSFDLQVKIDIIEHSIIKYFSGSRSNKIKTIIQKFAHMIFVLREPSTELKNYIINFTSLKPKRGRKPKIGGKKPIKKINIYDKNIEKIIYDTDTDVVCVHTLHSLSMNQASYAVVARANKAEGTIRLLNPSKLDDGWRDLNVNESPVYNVFLQIEIQKRNSVYEKFGVYGSVNPADKKFRIHNKNTESKFASSDARLVNRGIECCTIPKNDLVNLLYELGYTDPDPTTPINIGPSNKNDIIKKIASKVRGADVASWDNKKLKWYYKTVVLKKITRNKICSIIEQKFRTEGRIIEEGSFDFNPLDGFYDHSLLTQPLHPQPSSPSSPSSPYSPYSPKSPSLKTLPVSKERKLPTSSPSPKSPSLKTLSVSKERKLPTSSPSPKSPSLKTLSVSKERKLPTSSPSPKSPSLKTLSVSKERKLPTSSPSPKSPSLKTLTVNKERKLPTSSPSLKTLPKSSSLKNLTVSKERTMTESSTKTKLPVSKERKLPLTPKK